MRIGELARLTGVKPRLLRYYEERGLLHAARGANGYREYPHDAAERVAQIRTLLSTGMSTEVIRELLPHACGAEPEFAPDPELLATLADELECVDDKLACLNRTREVIAGYLDTARARQQRS
ncbi:MerR family transcriptional regulator [Saccharopolyspora elongata]|uniref:MerR family transcriptional regulator n=1 Tax=Saccharopolyspora elongata TaxID=2530387 RepID=A0A4R4Z1Y9_9PSEU|nr:MerR family transcriptional regulator [Saccharopolyspora elongata]TDD51370.1 MerR family transcriptional regulator [Saccharopolyspora elongata]